MYSYAKWHQTFGSLTKDVSLLIDFIYELTIAAHEPSTPKDLDRPYFCNTCMVLNCTQWPIHTPGNILPV